MDSFSDFPSSPTASILLDEALDEEMSDDFIMASFESMPPSPPTVIIPAITNTNTTTNTRTTPDSTNKSNLATYYAINSLLGQSFAESKTSQNMTHLLNRSHEDVAATTTTTTNNHTNMVGGGGSTSPRTPRLKLDTNSVWNDWQQLMGFTHNNQNDHHHQHTTNNAMSVHTPLGSNIDCDQVQELLNSLSVNNTNNNNNINHHNNNNITYNPIDMMMMFNNNQSIPNNNTNTQGYLGSVLANCTNITLSPNMKHYHSKSPSMSSLMNGNNRGIKKQQHHNRSNTCFQSIQSYMVGSTTTPMVPNQTACGANTNTMVLSNSQSPSGNFHAINNCSSNMMNGGVNNTLNSPSVSSTCSSQAAIVSPANVSTNSFVNNNLITMNGNAQHQYGWFNNNNNNTQYSPIVNNCQGVNNSMSTSNKKGKIPGHRQDNKLINQQQQAHSKGLLVEANPNDRPIRMKQNKVKEGGFQVLMEDGISKKKKETGLQFHTCTFQQ